MNELSASAPGNFPHDSDTFRLAILDDNGGTFGYVQFVDAEYAQIRSDGDLFKVLSASDDDFYIISSGKASGKYLGITPNHWVYAISTFRLAPAWEFKGDFFEEMFTNQNLSAKELQIGEYLAAWSTTGSYRSLRVRKEPHQG